jgi:FKBP-type peptidyl-prolyl cis-trans isomerase
MPKEADSEAIGEQNKQPASKILPGLLPAEPTAKGEVKNTLSGVKYETIKEGTGATTKAGQRLTVHYVGTLDDGRKFDSSRDSGKPFPVTIGTGAVIKGWDEAVPGMKVGEIRKLTIPPSAGYGAQGSGERIPPNATLHFEIELLSAD